MGEWWFNDTGDNLLKGVEDDDTNPIRLPDDVLLDFLARIPAARASFDRLVPNMLVDEQTRLNTLAISVQLMVTDPVEASDRFQHSQNTVGIHTTGPRGGMR